MNGTPLKQVSQTELFIQKSLKIVEELMLLQVEGYHHDLKTATKFILSSNGKRIRPRLILLIGKLFNTDYDKLIILASAIEMLHTATLVHDDLIDNSNLRRGIPTLNSRWSPAATVLTGDFLFAAASELASKTNSIEIMQLFSRTLRTIVNGEVNQMFMNRWNTNIEDYYRRNYAKTASLFETSTQSVALISNLDNYQKELLRKFGHNLGMAYQIIDDILDYSGCEKMIGKPAGGDLRQGLVTLPMLHFIKFKPDDLTVKQIIAGEDLDEKDVQRLIHSIVKSKAIQFAQKDAEEFVEKGINCVQELPDSPERDELINLSRYIVKRCK